MLLKAPVLSSAALVGTLAMLATCFHCSTPSNAPADAGVVDAGADVRRPRDARVEPPEQDADAPDADSFDRSWLPGDWAPPPGTWPRCHLLIAQKPERDVQPLTWKACPSGRPGCKITVPDWDTLTLDREVIRFIRSETVQMDTAGAPYLLYKRLYPSTFQSGANHEMEVVQTLDGQPVYAMAQTSPLSSDCGGYLTLRRGGVTHHLFSENAGTPASVLWSTFETPRQYVSEVKVLRSQTANGGAGIQGSNTETAMLLNSNVGSWYILNRMTGVLVSPFEGAQKPSLDRMRSLPDGYLARKLSTEAPIMRIWNDGHIAPLLVGTGPNRYVTGYQTDMVQSNQLVWVEATNLFPPNPDPVVYAALMADSAATLVPRRVTAITDASGTAGSYFVAANGMALFRTSGTTALLVRISDGHQWTISAEPGMGFRDPLWISTEEVWIHTGKYFPPPDNVVTTNDAIFRLRIDTLGPGTPAL
jgi:hypothetical protein